MPKKRRCYHPIVIIVPHSALCSAVATRQAAWSTGEMRMGWNADYVPWDLTGRRNPRARHNWLVCRCQAHGCAAELAIYAVRVHEALGLDAAQWVGGSPP